MDKDLTPTYEDAIDMDSGKPEEIYQTSLWLPKKLHTKFKLLTIERGFKMTKVIRELIEEYVKGDLD